MIQHRDGRGNGTVVSSFRVSTLKRTGSFWLFSWAWMTSVITAKIKSVLVSYLYFNRKSLSIYGTLPLLLPLMNLLYFQALFSVDNFIHYMTVSLEMLMNEVKSKINEIRLSPGFTVCWDWGSVLCWITTVQIFMLCFRFPVWLWTWFRSSPCRLWGRCRSPPQGVCSSGDHSLSLSEQVQLWLDWHFLNFLLFDFDLGLSARAW